MRKIASIFLAIALASAPFRAGAVEVPYDDKLMRLAEILGSLHFLRNLCGDTGTEWRDRMISLVDAEQPEADRKEKLYARFNHGYRTFASTYLSCTEAAASAIDSYMKEGEALTGEIVARYGN